MNAYLFGGLRPTCHIRRSVLNAEFGIIWVFLPMLIGTVVNEAQSREDYEAGR
jgi:hypothetical protein